MRLSLLLTRASLLVISIYLLFIPAAGVGQMVDSLLFSAPGVPIENFEQEQTNMLGGRVRIYMNPPSGVRLSYIRTNPQEGRKCLKLLYKKAQQGWAGYYSVLKTGEEYLDVSGYNVLTFWVRGDKGGETFEAGLADQTWEMKQDSLKSGPVEFYLPAGTVTTEWQEAVVPLAAFGDLDLTTIASFAVNFYSVGEGTVYLDNVQFEQREIQQKKETFYEEGAASFVVADFDSSDRNAAGNAFSAYQESPSAATVILDDKNSAGGRALRLNYQKGETGGPYGKGGWCGVYTVLRRGNDYVDVTPFNAVQFDVRGAAGGEHLELGMADQEWMVKEDSVKAGDLSFYLPGGITTKWQRVTIPLADFSRLQLTEIGSLAFNAPVPGEGAVWIDNIAFVKAELTELPLLDPDDPQPILADFEMGEVSNTGGRIATYGSGGAYADVLFEKSEKDQNRILKIKYHKSAAGWCGAYVQFKRGSRYVNASAYAVLAFDLRGSQGGERFTLALSDYYWDLADDSQNLAEIETYLPEGVSTTWQTVRIPLDSLPAGLDRTRLASLVFKFTTASEGQIEVDNIRLESSK